ncbi:MAG: stage II sporulation protein P [Clostridiales bacterium]|nr:stage II sporulation protein P [Clostridiales bacterium]
MESVYVLMEPEAMWERSKEETQSEISAYVDTLGGNDQTGNDGVQVAGDIIPYEKDNMAGIKGDEKETLGEENSEERISTEGIGETKEEEILCYSSEQLADPGYLLDNIFCVDSSTTSEGIDWDSNEFLEKDFTMEKASEPQILIYHTHSQEAYADSVEGESATTVQGVGEELARILREDYGYQVIHNTSTFDVQGGELDRNRAYTYAQNWLSEFLENNPGIQVIIDLHRDSVGEDNHLVTEIDGRKTAQVMLFNGLSRNTRGSIESLENPYLTDNLAFSFQLKVAGDTKYPDFYRRIYLKGYRYNLHFRPRSLLLEVGAQNNTWQEAANAMIPMAELLDQVLQGKVSG